MDSRPVEPKTAATVIDVTAGGDDVPVIRFDDHRRDSWMKDDSQDADSDELSALIGHYGRWQFFWTFLLALFQIPCTWQIFAYVFQGTPQSVWCKPPAFIDLELVGWQRWSDAVQPCKPLNESALLAIDERLADYACTAFVFDGPGTVPSEWPDQLQCHDGMASLVDMCFLAGAGVGSMASGYLSDKYGRRHTLMANVLLQAVLGTAVAFAPSLPGLMVMRAALGFVSMSVLMISFVLLVELVSGRWRTIIGILGMLPIAIAYVLMAGIAYVSPDWRTTQLVITLPWVTMLLMWYRLPESPRWLLVNGRMDELIAVIRVAARWNRIQLPANFEKQLQRPDEEVTVGFCQLFRGTYTYMSLLTMVSWYTMILLYFGITLGLNHLGGDLYLNTVIVGSLEAVSVVLSVFVVLRFGLKLNLIGYLLIAGIACVMVNVFPSEVGTIALAMVGKCATGATNALIPTYTAMQYPTSMRTVAVGLGQIASGLALTTVPYVWLLREVQHNLPMTIMGIFGMIGAFALFMFRDDKTSTTATSDKSTKATASIGGAPNKGFSG